MNSVTLMSKSDDQNTHDVAELKIASEKTNYLDRLTDKFSDWCSPILVKETRQALKSRQFFWTFFLLLVAIAIWTMLGLTVNDASVEFGNAGPNLFVGYLLILGFPLAIVIPFGAYRSLAREYEDGTIQLVSVTTMNAWQIVAGKLGSSMLQTLIYLSVIAPCIAFTYLLRGLSLPQITVGILVCVTGSFSLSCVALFFASATRSRIYGVGVSIVLILTQVATFIFWGIFTVALATGELALIAGFGILITAGLGMAILSTGTLAFAGAASMISFEADNRSSLVRAMMLLQQTLFIAWSITISCYMLDRGTTLVGTFVTSHYWLIMGFILIGEDEGMSERVKRSIPQSLFGRTFGSWFFPGSGRGLIFATVNIWFCGFVFLLIQWVGYEWLPEPESTGSVVPAYRNTPAWADLSSDIASVVSVCLYSSFFLALTYFICKWYRRNQRAVFGLLSFVTGVVSIFIFTGGSLLVHFNILSSRDWDQYSLEQLFNMYWTSTELMEGWDLVTEPMLLLFAAFCMLSICLFAWICAARELSQARELTPERVQMERAEERKREQLPKGESIDEIFAELDRPSSDIE